jgi:mannose-6-phosphate isomerase-like protein (cupin superfamily)
VIIRKTQRKSGTLRNNRGFVERIIDETVGARNVDVHVNRIQAGTPPGPYHYHTSAENAYLVLSGRLLVKIAGDEHVLSPGDAAFVPPRVPHSVHNIGNTTAEVLEIYSPASVDFVELGDMEMHDPSTTAQ